MFGRAGQLGGVNYLIPVDADIANEREVVLGGVSAGDLLRTLEMSEVRQAIPAELGSRNVRGRGGMKSGDEFTAGIMPEMGRSRCAFHPPPSLHIASGRGDSAVPHPTAILRMRQGTAAGS